MDSKKYQIFISSTYRDLEKEREAVIKSILELYHIPIGMEMFSAEDEDQWEIIRRTISVSDYYVLILGLRYGSKTSDDISFTQKEYEYARSQGIPVLSFVMSDSVPLPKNRRDDDLAEVNAFRNLVLTNSKMAQYWNTPDELVRNVSVSLMKQIAQRPGIGWVRGDKALADEGLSKELSILSRENRELRDTVARLEAQISTRAPRIEVRIDDLNVGEEYKGFEPKVMPAKLAYDEVSAHLRPYVSAKLIDEYNSSLPLPHVLDEYNRLMDRCFKVTSYRMPIVVRVSNLGNVKANNVYVEIEFPDGLILLEKDFYEEVPDDVIPESPVAAAESLYRKAQESKRSLLFPNFNYGGVSSVVPSFNYPALNAFNKGWDSWIEGNKLTIKINSLLHTRTSIFDDEYIVVPMALGVHPLRVNVICEEIQESLENLIDFSVIN